MCVFRPFDEFGTKPWENYKNKTKVKPNPAPDMKPEEWEDLY